MKILLAVTMTMLIGNSAFAACSVTTPNECTDKAQCEGLSDNSMKFTYTPSAPVKCMNSSAGPVATNCTENSSVGRGALDKSDAKVEAGSTTGAGRSR